MDSNNIIPSGDGSEIQIQQQLHEQNQQLKLDRTRLEAVVATQHKSIVLKNDIFSRKCIYSDIETQQLMCSSSLVKQ